MTVADDVARVLAERDAIQANLLELDASFVRQVLDGAPLTGQTRERWATASATHALLWETYLAYSAVVDRIAALSGGQRGPAKRDLPELTGLLTGPCVQLPGPPVPLARRDLADSGRPPVTLAAVVGAMRGSFTEVTGVTSAVEAVWAATGPLLDAAAADLALVRPLLAGLGEEAAAEFRAADAALEALRAASTADPLALWEDGRVAVAAADRLRDRARALAARIADLDRLRREARQRIDALAAATASARAARAAAAAGWRAAAERVAAVPPVPPDIPDPPARGLSLLADAGRWTRLAAELDRCEAALRAAEAGTTDLRGAAAAALARSDELRGLLAAYKAKAARLGAVEEAALMTSYEQARELLRAVPCDLAAAESAVTAYQQAILATEGRR